MTIGRRQYSPLERQGVNAVERHILGYHWIFREHAVSDFGIDAEIEICDDGVPTGRLMKLQIKSGMSWFRERRVEGVVFRGSSDHFKYWLGHSLPVVLMLYDSSSEQVWWVHIERNRVEGTGKNCKILIPSEQQLSPLSARLLRTVALGRTEDRVTATAPLYALPDTLIRSIQEARKSIDIATPQLSESLRHIVFDSVSRGVRIRMILSENRSDLLLESEAMRGFDITLREIKSLHLKQVVIDKEIAIYGSSFDLTAQAPEVLFQAKDPRLVSSLSEAFEHAWSLSVEVGHHRGPRVPDLP